MEHINDILAKHFSGLPLSDDEQLLLEKWKLENGAEYAAMEETLNAAPDYQYTQFNTSKAWEKMDARIEEQPTKVFFLKPLLKYAVAVSIAILIGITGYKFILSDQAEFIAFHNNDEAVKSLELPDGSLVYLAKNTTVEYQKDFKDNRNVKLNGEAFFDVVRDEQHTFKINTSYGDVSVLGTSFNVNTKFKETTVSVKSGRVALENKNDKIELTVNESASSDGQSISEKTRANTNVLSWKTGHFTFENTPIDEAIRDINSYYDQMIINESQEEECRITGVFKNQKLDEIIEALALSCNLEFSKKNNKFILK